MPGMLGFIAEEESMRLGLAVDPLKLGLLEEASKGVGPDDLKLGFGKGCKFWPAPDVRLAAVCGPSPARLWVGLGTLAAAVPLKVAWVEVMGVDCCMAVMKAVPFRCCC